MTLPLASLPETILIVLLAVICLLLLLRDWRRRWLDEKKQMSREGELPRWQDSACQENGFLEKEVENTLVSQQTSMENEPDLLAEDTRGAAELQQDEMQGGRLVDGEDSIVDLEDSHNAPDSELCAPVPTTGEESIPPEESDGLVESDDALVLPALEKESSPLPPERQGVRENDDSSHGPVERQNSVALSESATPPDAESKRIEELCEQIEDLVEDLEDDARRNRRKLEETKAEKRQAEAKVRELEAMAKGLESELEGVRIDLGKKTEFLAQKKGTLKFMQKILTAKDAEDTATADLYGKVDAIVSFVRGELRDFLVQCDEAQVGLEPLVEKSERNDFFGSQLERWAILQKKKPGLSAKSPSPSSVNFLRERRRL